MGSLSNKVKEKSANKILFCAIAYSQNGLVF